MDLISNTGHPRRLHTLAPVPSKEATVFRVTVWCHVVCHFNVIKKAHPSRPMNRRSGSTIGDVSSDTSLASWIFRR